MKNDQMHLGFDKKRNRMRTRRSRHDARWWFLQMHRAVDENSETGVVRQIKDDDFSCPNERD